MTKKKKRKKLTKKELQQRKQIYKNIFFCFVVVLFISLVGYFIFYTDLLKPKVNQLTASYISFNNEYATDMLKVSDLRKTSDKVGMSVFNKSEISFKITGKENSEYDIVLYPINDQIDLYKINYYLFKNKNDKIALGNLDNLQTSEDKGIIIYQGDVSNKETLKLRMWISKDYKKNTNNIAFEVKVKPR